METSVKERLKSYLKDNKIAQKDFCLKIGVSPSFISGMRESIQPDKLKSIALLYPSINIKWLLTGLEDKREEKNEITNLNYKLVPLYDIDNLENISSQHNSEINSKYLRGKIPFANVQEEDMAVIETGDSMAPTCIPGSKLLIREIKDWKEYFGYGNIFLILLKDKRKIIKEIQPSLINKQKYILCISHNTKYPPEELPTSMISSVFQIIRILNEKSFQ